MAYRQIISEERYMLAVLRKQGFTSPRSPVRSAGIASTISRELRRNCSPRPGCYRPSKAIEKCNGRRSRSRRNQHFTSADFKLVESLLRRQWSPEQVPGHLRRHGELSISHETIYQHIWLDRRLGGSLYTHLRGARKQRRKRYGAYDSRGRLAGKRHISERPRVAERRTQLGHWEIDTIIGKGSRHCLVRLVDRKTGYLLLGKLKARTKKHTNHRTLHLLRRHGELVRTITADNGTEFHDYSVIEEATGTTFYFATPYHSWERGTIENTNGLIGQYVPKSACMTMLSQKHCNAIANKLKIDLVSDLATELHRNVSTQPDQRCSSNLISSTSVAR